MHKYIIFSGLSLFALLSGAYAQENYVHRLSPLEVISMRYDDAYVKIVYSKPKREGRKVFGGLVPYDEVWRTGNNEATEITLTRDVLINKDTLKAGTYSMFTIPGEQMWTIIFNSDLGLFGSYNYREENDVLRFEVPSSISTFDYEYFTIEFLKKGLSETEIALRWDKTVVRFPLEFIVE